MLRLLKIFFILILSSKSTFCQVQSTYTFPKTIPEKYVFDASKEYDNLSNNGNIEKNIQKKDLTNYAELVSYGKSNLFKSGQIYLSWNEMEVYLNQILDKLLENNKKNCKIYIVRNPNYNAFAIHDGSLFVNIGLLADVYNESSLAIIISHEIAHYLKNHVKKQYFENVDSYSKKNRNKFELKLQNAHKSREDECEADSIGFELSFDAGYDLRYGLNNFNHFLIEELIQEDKRIKDMTKTNNSLSPDTSKNNIETVLNQLLSSHPVAEARINALKRILKIKKEQHNTSGNEFLISKSQFYILQEKARKEVLYLHIKNNEYDECIKRAFEYYIQSPDDDLYIYYLLEGIRRKLYVNKSVSDEGFLTEGFEAYFNKGEGILNNLPLLIRDSIKYSTIKTKKLLPPHKVPFNNYKEAFEYFKEIAVNREIKESFLTIALYEKDKNEQNKYLQRYLLFDDIKYQKFAQELLKNKLDEQIKKNRKREFHINDILFIEDHYYGYQNNLIKRNEKSKMYAAKVEKMMNKYFSDRDVIFYNDILATDFNKYMTAKYVNKIIQEVNYRKEETENKTATESLYFDGSDSGEKEIEITSPFILDPAVWDYFMRHKISSFESIFITSWNDYTTITETIITSTLSVALATIGAFTFANKTESNRYAFYINYYAYNGKDIKVYNQDKYTPLKMRAAYLNNSIYHLLYNLD